jgi:hypothetical protein
VNPKRFATPNQIAGLYPGAFKKSSVRYLIVQREKNGFDCCIRRFGKKILIDLDEFEKWISEQNEREGV